MTVRDRPAGEDDASYSCDLLGRLVGATDFQKSLTFSYDALGRTIGQTSRWGTIASTYDLAGRRTRITHPDGFFVDQDYLTTGEMIRIRENGAVSGVGVLATFAYDDLGRRTSLTRGNGTVTTYAHDRASRLTQMLHDAAGTAHDLTLGFTYNPASQIVSNTRSNDAFAQAPVAGTQTAAPNGLNQLAQVDGAATSHDARGNMTSDGALAYSYSSQNLLTNAGAVRMNYDALLRLTVVDAGPTQTRRFDYDGGNLIAEYAGNERTRRYVHGPGIDEPLVEYEGSGTSIRRFLHADERGSIVAHSDSAGTVTQVNRYDEYGQPASGNAGRFQYTGLPWIAEIGLQYSRARMYNPRLGRFMQADPIGYGDGMNVYAYSRCDPVNRRDSSGRESGAIVVTGRRLRFMPLIWTVVALGDTTDGGGGGGGGGGGDDGGDDAPRRDSVTDCNPQQGTTYATAREATLAGARATAIMNNQQPRNAWMMEFHAAVTPVRGGFTFRITGRGPITGGSVPMTFGSNTHGSAHNHEAGDTYMGRPGHLSTADTNRVGNIQQDSDQRAYTTAFREIRGLRNQLHIALAGPDGNLYYWRPGQSVQSEGQRVGPVLCGRR
jgi:RHS repeat-associated protein